MGKLHELLAVEGDREGLAKRVVDESINTFTKRVEHFTGMTRSLIMFDESEQRLNTIESKDLDTTVGAKLKYVEPSVIDYIDVRLQKEATNQKAVADLIVDGVTFATDLPATFLLGMESYLKNLRTMYEAIPTLDPGRDWKKDTKLGDGVYVSKQNDKFKTAKKFQYQILVAPTDKHPAQVEKWEEQVPIGKYEQLDISGKISPAEKSALLGKVDKLIQAVKQARQRANTTDVVVRTIGKELFDFIHS